MHSSTVLEPQKRKRIHFLDELRGLAIVAMVFYHGFFSLAYVFNNAWGYRLMTFFMPLQPVFAALFIVLSGISSMLSRSNYRRGVKLFLVAIAVTLVTVFAAPGMEIKFGILHFLSLSMILFGAVKKWVIKWPIKTGVILCLFLFLFTYNLPEGILGFKPFLYIDLPKALYSTEFLFPLGLPSPSFASSDYFPFIPWVFMFFAGGFLGIPVAEGNVPSFMYKRRIRPFAFAGRHSLIIYILHQPVIFGLMYVLEFFLK